MNRLDVNDLLNLGVQFDMRQLEALTPGAETVAWMVPWTVPNPVALGTEGIFEPLMLPDAVTGAVEVITWPRPIHQALDFMEEDIHYTMEDAFGSGWDLLPQVIGYTGHEECDATGCCHDDSPGLIGVWGAYPLNLAEAVALENAIVEGIHLGPWRAIIDLLSFEDRHEVSLEKLYDMATEPIPEACSPNQRAAIEDNQRSAEYYLDEYVQTCDHLGIEPTYDSFDPDDFSFTTQDFRLDLDPDLQLLWDVFAIRAEKTRKQLIHLMPEQRAYINWSSIW